MEQPVKPTLLCSDLSKRFGDFTALDRLALRIEPGEIVALLGPNGAGKTTMMRLVMGLLVPSEGSAHVLGMDCQKDSVEVKRHVGYLPDQPAFFDYLRGRELLGFVGEMHGFSRREADERAIELIAEFGLADAAEEFAVNYSLGMKKKLAIAAALMHEPELLILDEPTNGLDPRASAELITLFRKLCAQGKTVLLSTHLLEMAERVAHRVAILDRGKLVASGPVEDLRAQLSAGGSLHDVYMRVTVPAGEAV
ncbi:MAG: ABC transporter ATP-binding protein [Deltaproteobacteria bacterium]|nr:ABC transporter ATP-binding protein [Deltaproteobacteria bacterium]